MRTFYIGDILNLVFQNELFWKDGKSVGTEELIIYMLGIDDDTYDTHFDDDYLATILTDLCISSLEHQHEFLRTRRFRKSVRALIRRLEKHGDDEEYESNWIRAQTERYDEMLLVNSIAFLFIPEGQERFRYVQDMDLFTDRPMNIN